jgi:hypothetical protein
MEDEDVQVGPAVPVVRRAGDYERFVDALTEEDGRVDADARGPKNLYSEDVEGMGSVGVAFSRIEVRKIKRRMRRSHRFRAELGVAVGGARPFRLAGGPQEVGGPNQGTSNSQCSGDCRARVPFWLTSCRLYDPKTVGA